MTMKTLSINYCRVSSKRQKKEGNGVSSQDHNCTKYSNQRGYTYDSSYDDDVSGGKDDRSGIEGLFARLSELQSQIKNGSIEVVVVIDDIKRWARDVDVHRSLKKTIEAYGARLESPNYSFGNTPEDEFIETVLAAQGELERKQNRRQVIQKMKARLEQGFWCFDHPPAYTSIKAPEGGKVLVPDEPKASIVTEALEGFASGRFKTQKDVQHFLQSKDFTHRSKAGVVHLSQVERLLTRLLYAGYLEYPKWDVKRRKAKHEGLIDLETYERIQDRLKEEQSDPQREDINADFPLRGFVLCAHCREPVTAGWTTGRNKKKPHPYYRCKTTGCCMRSKSIRRQDIEDHFEEMLAQVKPRPKIMEVVKHELLTLWNQRMLNVEQIRESRRQKLEQIDKEIENCTNKIEIVTNETVIKKLEMKVTTLEAKKLRLGEKIDISKRKKYNFEDALNRVCEFLKDPLLMWKTGDLEQRRLVLRMVFDEALIYDREEGFCTPSLSLPVELSCVPELDKLEMVEML